MGDVVIGLERVRLAVEAVLVVKDEAAVGVVAQSALVHVNERGNDVVGPLLVEQMVDVVGHNGVGVEEEHAVKLRHFENAQLGEHVHFVRLNRLAVRAQLGDTLRVELPRRIVNRVHHVHKIKPRNCQIRYNLCITGQSAREQRHSWPHGALRSQRGAQRVGRNQILWLRGQCDYGELGTVRNRVQLTHVRELVHVCRRRRRGDALQREACQN